MGFIKWITAWLLLITISVALSRTTPGERLLYYAIWLSIVLILVTHYQEITDLFLTAGQGSEPVILQGQT
jgi:predicted aspartyl protease